MKTLLLTAAGAAVLWFLWKRLTRVDDPLQTHLREQTDYQRMGQIRNQARVESEVPDTWVESTGVDPALLGAVLNPFTAGGPPATEVVGCFGRPWAVATATP